MSHSLHRRGDVEFLKKDWLLKATPVKGVDNATEESKKDYLARIRAVCDVTAKYAINMGIGRSGCFARGVSLEEIKASYDRIGVAGISASVMTSREAVKAYLQELKEKDYGISICAAGLIDEIFEIGREIGLPPHSVLLSLGVWGKKEMLPAEDVLTITAMCGHHMLAPNLVEFVAAQVKAGTLPLEEAAHRLSRVCTCGSINEPAVVEALQKMVAEGTPNGK